MSITPTAIEAPLLALTRACVTALIILPAALAQHMTASHLAAAIAGEPWTLPPPEASCPEEPPSITFSHDADGRKLRLGLLWALHIIVFHNAMNLPWALHGVTLALGAALGSVPLLVPHRIYAAHALRRIAVYAIYLYACSLLTARIAQRYQSQSSTNFDLYIRVVTNLHTWRHLLRLARLSLDPRTWPERVAFALGQFEAVALRPSLRDLEELFSVHLHLLSQVWRWVLT